MSAFRTRARGIPAEATERICEKFGTLNVRTEGKYHSAGLGLAFCKLAVEAHGGAIASCVPWKAAACSGSNYRTEPNSGKPLPFLNKGATDDHSGRFADFLQSALGPYRALRP